MPLRPQCAMPAPFLSTDDRPLSAFNTFAADPRRYRSPRLGSTTSHLFTSTYSLSTDAVGVQNRYMFQPGTERKAEPRRKSGPGRSEREGISLLDLFKLFPDDDAAKQWFVRLRWPTGEICCHYCGSFNVQVNCAHKSMDYRCRERDCAKRFSVRSGTVMQSSKLGYQVWAIATYMLLTNLKGVSSMKLHRDLDITQKSAWHLAHRLRAALTTNERTRFSGPVEADETYVGGKAKNMHRKQRKKLAGRGSAGKAPIAGVRDRATGRVRVNVRERDDQRPLKEFVRSTTKPDTLVFTDEATAYRGLPLHESVTHSIGQYVRDQAHINGLESFWSLLKRGIMGVYHRMSWEHLHRYAGEFEGRHNMRGEDTIDQMALVGRDSEGKQVRYRDLVEEGEWATRIALFGWTPPDRSHLGRRRRPRN